MRLYLLMLTHRTLTRLFHGTTVMRLPDVIEQIQIDHIKLNMKHDEVRAEAEVNT